MNQMMVQQLLICRIFKEKKLVFPSEDVGEDVRAPRNG
jgi:hypothetical protein